MTNAPMHDDDRLAPFWVSPWFPWNSSRSDMERTGRVSIRAGRRATGAAPSLASCGATTTDQRSLIPAGPPACSTNSNGTSGLGRSLLLKAAAIRLLQSPLVLPPLGDLPIPDLDGIAESGGCFSLPRARAVLPGGPLLSARPIANRRSGGPIRRCLIALSIVGGVCTAFRGWLGRRCALGSWGVRG